MNKFAKVEIAAETLQGLQYFIDIAFREILGSNGAVQHVEIFEVREGYESIISYIQGDRKLNAGAFRGATRVDDKRDDSFHNGRSLKLPESLKMDS